MSQIRKIATGLNLEWKIELNVIVKTYFIHTKEKQLEELETDYYHLTKIARDEYSQVKISTKHFNTNDTKSREYARSLMGSNSTHFSIYSMTSE